MGEINRKATPSVLDVALPILTSHNFWPCLSKETPIVARVDKAATGNFKVKAQHREFCLAAVCTNPYI